MNENINTRKFENLKTLAKYLEDLEINGLKFSMERYHDYGNFMSDIDLLDCGTGGCAVGHAPYAGIEKLKGEDFTSYSHRTLVPVDHGLPMSEIDDQQQDIWDWLFSDDWAAIDDTPEGAAARIRAFIDRPEIIEEKSNLLNFDMDEDVLEDVFEDYKQLISPYHIDGDRILLMDRVQYNERYNPNWEAEEFA